MKQQTFGSLTIDDVGCVVQYNEPGLTLSGKLRAVEHSIDWHGEKETKVSIQPAAGGWMSVARPPSASIKIQESDDG